MPTIVDYASLSQAIQDFTHRSSIAAFVDYFIQGAQEQIVSDILQRNFGKAIRLMEAAYNPIAISWSGTAPVPSDWIAPKDFTILDGSGDEWPLEFKDPTWIYARYPLRQPDGIPGYIAREVVTASGGPSAQAPYASFTATAGQTVFSLTSLNGATVVLVSLDGQALNPADYTVSGSTLTLGTGALLGQTLIAQALPLGASLSSSGSQTFTATAGQTNFTLSSPLGSYLLFVTLDGAVINPSEYSLSGSTLTLTSGALAGQTLRTQYVSNISASGTSVFIFGPYPDDAYTIQGTYYQSPPLLSASQTTNWLMTGAPNLLLAGCMREASKFLKDTEAVEQWGAMYDQRIASLIASDAAEMLGSGPLVINVGLPSII